MTAITTTSSRANNISSSVVDGRPRRSRIAVFYNIFVPPQGEDLVMEIVQEQILQLGVSAAAAKGDTLFYYNTIGDDLDPRCFMDLLCDRFNLTCFHMNHYAAGMEDVTLQGLYEFCTHTGRFENEDDYNSEYDFRVIYMHSKGSYHNTEQSNFSQNSWRWHMTKAITHEWCVDPPLPAHHAGCDICGLIALPYPNLHFAGNFFNARCSYIQKLIPPEQFTNRMNDLYNKTMQRKKEGTFITYLLPDADHHFGINRFAMEHWLGSHPDAIACDLSTVPRLQPWQFLLRGRTPYRMPYKPFQFALFPRFDRRASWSYLYWTEPVHQIHDVKRFRMREYYFLPGNLFRWFELYGKVPEADSWVWSWYLDGPEWLDAVQKHGPLQAIDMLTSKYAAES